MIRIALDGMGGDHAPSVTVAGAVLAAREFGHAVILVGKRELLEKELSKHAAGGLPIHIYPAEQVVGMEESPAQACRQKPDSSIMMACDLVSRGEADAVVSAGNSGATMTAALMRLRRLPGVSRPAITTLMPTLKGFCVLTDVGANVDCKPKHLLQFAIMGNLYVKCVLNRPAPRVGLLSIGEEVTKGNELTLSARELLSQNLPNFIGNVEGRDIPKGTADVVVCDGFVGNVVLKFGEGLAEAMMALIKEGVKKHPLSVLAAIFLRGIFKDIRKKIDYAEYGGAPLLGVNGVCIISHGGSNAKAIKNAIRAAGEAVKKRLNHEIRRELEKFRSLPLQFAV